MKRILVKVLNRWSCYLNRSLFILLLSIWSYVGACPIDDIKCDYEFYGNFDNSIGKSTVCLNTDESVIIVSILISEKERKVVKFDGLFGSASGLYETGYTIDDYVTIDGNRIVFRNLAKRSGSTLEYYFDVEAEFRGSCFYFIDENLEPQCIE